MDRQRKVSLDWRVFLSISLFSFLAFLISLLIIYAVTAEPLTLSGNIIWKICLLGIVFVSVLSMVGYFLLTKEIIPMRFSLLDNLKRRYEDLVGHSAEMVHEERLRDYAEDLEQKVEERTKELKESEERYKSLWENAEDTMMRIDLTKRVIAANKREEEILGYPRKDFLGKEIYCILPVEYHNVFDMALNEALNGGKAPTTEIQVVTNAKGILSMELDMRGIANGDKIACAQIHLRDITGRKRLEQQLIRAEKMAVLSRFSTTLAHDLRNPVIGIKKTLEMLQQFPRGLNEDTSKNLFADLITSSDLLLGMINDVLDLYQDSYKELPLLLFHFFMAETLDEVIKLLRFQIEEKRVHIELDRAEDLVVRGDKRRLQRVFINLLDNAIKFSPSGGQIKIVYRPVINEDSRYLYFEIVDEGPGIRPEDLPKIFEPFFSGESMKSFKKGAGLGLYFCKVIVEAHHGKIWAENRENLGAVFCISLPIEEEGVTNV